MKMTGAFYKCRTLAVVAILFSLDSVTPLMAPSAVTPEGAAEKGTSRASSKTTLGGATVAESPIVQPSTPWNKLRLPKTLTPQHYDVELQPYLQKDSRGLYIFKGKSTAYFTCAIATNLILIHSNKLNYTMQGGFLISLKVADGSPAPAIKRTWLETPTQYLVVELNRNLEVGKEYSLYSEFTGELADDLAGFYRSEYKEGNETRIIATTQMEPADARKAFPCFDEPAMKATFTITVVHMPQFVAISNMPRISTVSKVIDGVTWHATTFQRSPKMSTYLLACVVSDFDKVEQTNNGVQIRIWARKKAIEQNQGAYALNVTGLILNFYTNYYNTSYPLPKSDQVALPDFSAGAMENWGLITYRESYLFDPQVSSMSNKGDTLTVLAHELAHQWFGNLVTIRWWNDIWLNEGFATYIEYLGADQAEPTWNMKDLMVFNEIYPAMGTDALASSHPLSSNEEEVNSPAEIYSLFDVISYCKGAAVIRMMAAFLSEELFVKGLSSYLHANAYGNTIYSDLWDHLQKAVDHQTLIKLPKSIKTIMDTWVLQMGFPVVTVNTATGEISQKHFLLDPESNVTRPSEFNYVWTVPVTSMKKGVRQPDYWLQKTSAINNAWKVAPGSSDWILVNLNVTGFYRVNYDEENWKRMLQQLNKDPSVIPIFNRAQIISDAFNFARAQHLNVTSALETTKFLSKETEYLPWQAALTSMRYFQQMLDRSSDYGPMRQYLRKKVIPLFQHFKTVTSNWTYLPRELTKQYNEMNAFSAACTYGIQECLTLASDLYKKWMADPTNNPSPATGPKRRRAWHLAGPFSILGPPVWAASEDPLLTFGSFFFQDWSIPPILRPAISCNAIALGGEKEWDFAWEMLRNAGVASEAADLRAALTCSKEPWILNRYLEYTLDATKIRRQDAAYIIYLIAANAVGQSLAWDFLRAKWELLFNVFGPSFSFSGLITGVTQRFSSKFELAQLEQFKKDNEHIGFGSGALALEQALEKTKANIKWMQENREPVRLWFEAESRSS